VAPSQIRPRIGDALRRQESDAIPSTDKAAESWAAFFVAVFFFYPSVACPPPCAAAWRARKAKLSKRLTSALTPLVAIAPFVVPAPEDCLSAPPKEYPEGERCFVLISEMSWHH
jgi:hypothetical protein